MSAAERCPECDKGFVVVWDYDAEVNAWDARCSERCGWTS
jgi:hypothetical protein